MKKITRIVLTGGPAAGKTSLISRILNEFKQEAGWRVITIPETATELISGFGIKPFGGCMSMLQFQDFVIADQLHKEQLALKAAEVVDEENVLIIYDRALLDDKAYITDAEFAQVLSRFDGRTEADVLAGYDAVLHLVTCAKGAEYAYNLGNTARTESIESAREMDDRTLRAWSAHPNLTIVDNSVNFEEKLNRAMREIYRVLGEPARLAGKHKYLIEMPDVERIAQTYKVVTLDMMQTYLTQLKPNVERRLRLQKNGGEYLYFYTEKHVMDDGSRWVTERPISEKQYVSWLMESDYHMHSVRKVKYRFVYNDHRMEIDVYPFSETRAVLFAYSDEGVAALPPEIKVIREVTGDPAYKNRQLAQDQRL
ncbi:MAG: AAA family ATPase [Oscillospiraceae bacterium]|nr:AAA family ATPase [Oscillospiraceae bacterium]